MDVHDKKTRSYNMSCIHSRDTKPETIVRKYIFKLGFRFKKNDKSLPGTPDIVLPKYKTCIFINGCFWHRHTNCKYFSWPKTNVEFWKVKICENVKRDNRNYNLLMDLGWKIIIIWTCQLRPEQRDNTLQNLVRELRNNIST
ncbi:very short patch repair endonuclease [Lawsonibacter faecis]|uniref:Very short patch repair endonuclease n=1 Tax=Lawsonibacter faecis TaxID=2763052 RepID=A0A8J6JJQ6_9FIRM|nr:DNA mismatch endonuclease Vsr [Lawsonibacter faecis]MBC5735495.1 DNA mismatch endonuclease Vsr [Lawsonibacter faecis]